MIHRLLAYALSTPWAMRPETMGAYAAVLASRIARKEAYFAAADVQARPKGQERAADPKVDSRGSGRRGSMSRTGSIAVIPVRGTIVQYADQLDLCEGGTTTASISQSLNSALADETVGSILLHIHSPGGSVYGVSELADEIRSAGKQKPITAFADSLAASAAYWIGSAAGEFYMTPGGEVGSVGVWSAHQNIAKALEMAGVDIKLISAGKFKTEGHPYGPLDADAERFMQSRVDDYYAMFTQAVAKGRNVPISKVREGMGQGRVVGASTAMRENMVDGVMTLPEVTQKMQRGGRTGPRRLTTAAIARRREREIEILSL